MPSTLRFDLQLHCDNAAFDDDELGLELARILERLARTVRADCDSMSANSRAALEKQGARGFAGHCFDVNGNRVGKWTLKPRRQR